MTIDEVNIQFDNLQAAVNKAEGDLTTYIQGLKDQIAAGTNVTPAQLDALGNGIKAVADGIAAFDINTTQPPAVSPAAHLAKKK